MLDEKNATQLAIILTKGHQPNQQILQIKHATRPNGKAHVLVSSLHPLEIVEQSIKSFMFLYGKINFPLQIIPVE
ncbi:MAG: hypothetical protein WC422_00625 [Candidatus Paceibacterota bacterium]